MAFHKCSWQILTWLSNDRDMVPRELNTINGDIHLTDHRGQRSLIKYKAHTEANVGLGFLLTLLESQEYELNKILEQTKECLAKVVTSRLSFVEA